MRQLRTPRSVSALALILATLTIAGGGSPIWAASHREAPLIALDPAADNTDVYAFVSYDAANLTRSPDDRRVTFIMNVNPGQDPGDGPNYFNFDDDVLYAINIDNDADGRAEDIVYEFRFKTENRPGPGGLTSPVPYLGNPHIPAGIGLPGITALDGPGSEGLTRRQTYSVTEVRGRHRIELFAGRRLVAVPSNVGPATMPNYPALAAMGIYTDERHNCDDSEGSLDILSKETHRGHRDPCAYDRVDRAIDSAWLGMETSAVANLRGIEPCLSGRAPHRFFRQPR